jgi:formylglycine-generating enzyme required for sulfatase activity
MIYVPPGDFIMGSPKGDGDPDEQPQRQVYLDAFWIDKTEVTNAEYRRFVEATGHRVPRYWDSAQLNRPGQPVVGVSWEDAQAYARWAGKHLPTEAEWEKAARGTDGRKYPWGNVWDAGATRRCNVLDRDDPTALGSVVSTDGYGCTAPVGSYPLGESPYGCLDMAGNAWEWCADWYDSEYYGSGLRQNPRGAPGGEFRVLRGGSCESLAWELRCADRYYLDPSCMSGSTGFRCALSAE